MKWGVENGYDYVLELFGQQVAPGTYPGIQRNASRRKEVPRNVPRPVVVEAMIEGHRVRALIDSGSLGDFMSATLAEQLKLKRIELASPISMNLAVQGSRTKVNFGMSPRFQYQGIDESRYFDIINLSNYDVILGTPFLYQHQVLFGLNPTRVVIGSEEALPLEGKGVNRLASNHLGPEMDEIQQARDELMAYAQSICKSALVTPLPPLWKLNHRIPLIDPEKRYQLRRARCPEPLKKQWLEKRNAYIKTGRWVSTTSYNAVPMLYITKPG
ncbi:hypothetical protein FA15DRAFT_604354, partial [Coprinopsis marcescibilis]